MNFLQLQDAVKSDRFREAQRGDIKTWINARYWWLWSLEDWPFRYSTADLTTTSGSQLLGGAPADLGNVLAIIPTNSGDPSWKLDYVSPRRFYADWYDPRGTDNGESGYYTIVNGDIFVAPAPDESVADWKLVYSREFSMLVDDDDVPALPDGAHLSLVFGGAATGLKLQNDPTWQAFEQDFNSAIQILRSGYLNDQQDPPSHWPADVG